MVRFSHTRYTNHFTQEPIKKLIQLILIVTGSLVVIDQIARHWYIALQPYFALTPDALNSFFIWQFLSSLLLIPSATFSFGFLLDVAFSMLVLWFIGTLLYERIGKKFFTLFVLSGIVAGIFALIAMRAFDEYTLFSECLAGILAVVTVWVMTDPKQQLLLFFVIPLQAKWVLIFGLLATVVANTLQQEYVWAFGYFAAATTAWLYGLMALGLQSPFEWMEPIDSTLKKVGNKLKTVYCWHLRPALQKIYSAMRSIRRK